MTIYSFYLFDRYCECIYYKNWHGRGPVASKLLAHDGLPKERELPDNSNNNNEQEENKVNKLENRNNDEISHAEEAKLVFGVVLTLRNIVNSLSIKPT